MLQDISKISALPKHISQLTICPLLPFHFLQSLSRRIITALNSYYTFHKRGDLWYCQWIPEIVQCSCGHCRYKRLHVRTVVHVSELQRTIPKFGRDWYPGSTQIPCCCVSRGDLEQPTALVETDSSRCNRRLKSWRCCGMALSDHQCSE
jgi:hypothetical protein